MRDAYRKGQLQRTQRLYENIELIPNNLIWFLQITWTRTEPYNETWSTMSNYTQKSKGTMKHDWRQEVI